MTTLVTALAALAGLTTVLAALLAIANRKLYVAEDPRIDEVEEMLPHTNCGACGFPGCRAFAEALVAGSTAPGKCTVSAPSALTDIAAYLGVEVGGEERRIARLACAGGTNVAANRAHYSGQESCAAAAVVAGGAKACSWGCLGLADCERVCGFDAITMNRHALPVVDPDLCTACGDCVLACPKDLFTLEPVSTRLWVACRSEEAGDEILEACQVACTACGRCAMDAPDVVEMKRQLPVVAPGHGASARKAIERCPTGAIVWLTETGAERGADARIPVRLEPRPSVPT